LIKGHPGVARKPVLDEIELGDHWRIGPLSVVRCQLLSMDHLTATDH
jgi:hypothetical protein